MEHAAHPGNPGQPGSQPNIIVLLIDDLGWRDLACYGSTFYETPVLDRLAREGMRFTDAYAASPVCSPTRASLLTGKTPARLGVTQFIGGHAVGRLCDVPSHQFLPSSEISLAAALREGGYQTWHVGKWHLGEGQALPERRGFDVNVGGCGWGMPKHGYFSPYRCPALADGPHGEYLTDRLTDEAIRLIRGRDRTRPFFLNFWHYAVHTPIQAPEPLIEKYRKKASALGLDNSPAIEVGEPFPCDHKRHQKITRRVVQSDPVYAAMVENLDTNVGRLLDVLASEGLEGETLVVFTSDNGGLSTAEGSPTCNLPLAEGKGWAYDGGTRVCQLVRWPGRVRGGTTCSAPTTTCDWYPTLLDAAGLPARPTQHADGVSLMPVLGATDPASAALSREALFWHYPHYSNQGGTPACSVRAGDWKLIEFFEDGHAELYNLREDLEEARNRAEDCPEIAAALRRRLAEWRKEVEAVVPRWNLNHQPPMPAEVNPRTPPGAAVDPPEM